MYYPGRRFHPPGTPLRVPRAQALRRRLDPGAVHLRGGHFVRSLTPRQAVVWLMRLDDVTNELHRAGAQRFTRVARGRLERALRARISSREGSRRRRSP